MPKYEAYHGKTSQYHQSRFDALSKNWKMISLSVHGSSSSPLYSAVWIMESGPKYVAVHDLPISKYQKWYDDQYALDYKPALVSAAGNGANAVVAAVFEKRPDNDFIAKHGLVNGAQSDKATIEFWCKEAQRNGMVLRSGSIYGSSSKRLYIAVWQKQSEAQWNWRVAEDTQSYQTWFDGFREVPLRPGFVTLSEHQIYLSAFRNDPIGKWYASHNMTSAEYQNEFEKYKEKGYYPISVQGGGVGSNTRYAAIFAKKHVPLPRKWTVRGTGLAKFDTAIKEFMLKHSIRAGQLSIAKNGTFRAQRAYTWAHDGYRITETNHLMRIASLSKMFTCACIQRLYDDGLVTQTTRVFQRLGITQKALNSQMVDPRVNDIEVEHLVDHFGGWDSSKPPGDYVFKMRKISNDLGLNGPPTKFDMVRYMYGEPIYFDPGTVVTPLPYSNIGYTTLAYLIEVVTGQSYEDYLRNTILQPDGITAVRLARTLQSQKYANEIRYDDPNVWYSAAEPTNNKLTASCHGGEGWVTEAMDGSGGLCGTASALVDFIHLHAVWGRGGRTVNARTGGMAGVTSRAQSRSDGVDFVYIFNSRHNIPDKTLDDFAVKLNDLLTSASL